MPNQPMPSGKTGVDRQRVYAAHLKMAQGVAELYALAAKYGVLDQQRDRYAIALAETTQLVVQLLRLIPPDPRTIDPPTTLHVATAAAVRRGDAILARQGMSVCPGYDPGVDDRGVMAIHRSCVNCGRREDDHRGR